MSAQRSYDLRERCYIKKSESIETDQDFLQVAWVGTDVKAYQIGLEKEDIDY